MFPVGRLEEVIGFFEGKVRLEDARKGGIKFEDAIAFALGCDFFGVTTK